MLGSRFRRTVGQWWIYHEQLRRLTCLCYRQQHVGFQHRREHRNVQRQRRDVRHLSFVAHRHEPDHRPVHRHRHADRDGGQRHLYGLGQLFGHILQRTDLPRGRFERTRYFLFLVYLYLHQGRRNHLAQPNQRRWRSDHLGHQCNVAIRPHVRDQQRYNLGHAGYNYGRNNLHHLGK